MQFVMSSSNSSSPGESRFIETVDTATAARVLGRKTRTLQKWHAYGGPIQPIVVHGRLRWRVSDIQNLLNPESEQIAQKGN